MKKKKKLCCVIFGKYRKFEKLDYYNSKEKQ